MVSIVIRELDASVKARLVAQARLHGHSMEAEARELIARGTESTNIGVAMLNAGRTVGGVESLPIPARGDAARMADFG
ncbi:toxin-antitoxin system [Curtobacterium sp. MCJR17_020]|uniref:FitA-like ribbon-helix-helix domain-containing protein n=1 Tax=Curtobacterium sp. MCJR17_020 TaxID=2175619 RepID=UPI000DAA1393|nr:toxin-antitoxin system [Curtobacterium sp. MCJR17_020]WIE73611.1 toxin-antitoxin system [Curtobacterium sp. MCJR17_020]